MMSHVFSAAGREAENTRSVTPPEKAKPTLQQFNRSKIDDMLKKANSLYESGNKFEALKIYEQEHCPICLLDISMPGMTGLEVAEAIREESADTSIIFLTAFDEFSFAKKAIYHYRLII